MTTAALLVAAGRGRRLGAELPKQYLALAGRPVLARTIAAFTSVVEIDLVRVVIRPEDAGLCLACIPGKQSKLGLPIHGGPTRQGSVRQGLEALGSGVSRVLIHDAARPLIDRDTIVRVLRALDQGPAAIAALPVADTLKRADGGEHIRETVDRSGLWRAQTPQGFEMGVILAAHRRAHAAGLSHFTDDAQIAEWAGIPVTLVAGSEDNLKITTRDDLERAERYLAMSLGDVRSGTGFDVHRFARGDHVWLCGVKIDHPQALEGHSDADVGLHALTDAILGALGDGDIGHHFPPGDPKWKGAPSRLFLADAARRVAERGGLIANVDITLLCEAPRIGPHREAMRAAIAEILGVEAGRIGVKATTTEGLGFTGRREGIAAMATATIRLPS